MNFYRIWKILKGEDLVDSIELFQAMRYKPENKHYNCFDTAIKYKNRNV